MGRKKKRKNYTKTIGFLALILAVIIFLKTTLFNDIDCLSKINFDLFKKRENIEVTQRSVQEDFSQIPDEISTQNPKKISSVEIFFTKLSGNKDIYVAVKREKNDESISDIKYSIKTLLQGPTVSEKKQGIYSEIPVETKLLSIKETNNKVIINLSSDFEYGGGGDSLYKRVYQLIKTVNRNTTKSVYLYIDNKQANVIGGEGLMLKQPLRKDSLDD